MTRDEVLALKPGRELDALIAEKVRGWTNFSPIDPNCDYSIGAKGRKNFAIDPRDGKQKPIPLYSSDISAAWDVAEGFDCHDVHKYKDRYVCAVYGNKINRAEGKTAPEAICKAALLAVMEG